MINGTIDYTLVKSTLDSDLPVSYAPAFNLTIDHDTAVPLISLLEVGIRASAKDGCFSCVNTFSNLHEQLEKMESNFRIFVDKMKANEKETEKAEEGEPEE